MRPTSTPFATATTASSAPAVRLDGRRIMPTIGTSAGAETLACIVSRAAISAAGSVPSAARPCCGRATAARVRPVLPAAALPIHHCRNRQSPYRTTAVAPGSGCRPRGARRFRTRPVSIRPAPIHDDLLALLPLLLVLGLLASGRASAPQQDSQVCWRHLPLSSSSCRRRASTPWSPGRARTAAGAWLSWHVIAIIALACSSISAAAGPRRLGLGWRAAANPRRCGRCASAGAVRGIGDRLRRRLHHRPGRVAAPRPGRPFGSAPRPLQPVAGAVGALATGTTVGATLAGLTPNQLGLSSALLQMPIHVLYLVFYWRLAREAGPPSLSTRRSTMQSGLGCCSA